MVEINTNIPTITINVNELNFLSLFKNRDWQIDFLLGHRKNKSIRMVKDIPGK